MFKPVCTKCGNPLVKYIKKYSDGTYTNYACFKDNKYVLLNEPFEETFTFKEDM